MCGIIGYVSTKNLSENRDWLAQGSNTIIHRGPDGYGEWYSTDGKVGMGHRRLSIIDLTESASQPMKDLNNGNVIIYNGELYNYLELKKELIKNGYNFNTKSDTEVLMYAYDMWGLECVSRFPVGSSARMTSGSLASARAMATRCRCPPDIWSGLLRA